jgi:hypothetical protein
MSVLLVAPAASKGGRGKLLYLPPPPKTNRWKLASKKWNIRFWNRNIRNLKTTRYRQNRTLRFGKSNCHVFPGSVRGEVYVAIVFHSSHLCFYAMLSIEILLAIHVVSRLIERQPILKIKYKIHFFNLSLHNVDPCHFISF